MSFIQNIKTQISSNLFILFLIVIIFIPFELFYFFSEVEPPVGFAGLGAVLVIFIVTTFGGLLLGITDIKFSKKLYYLILVILIILLLNILFITSIWEKFFSKNFIHDTILALLINPISYILGFIIGLFIFLLLRKFYNFVYKPILWRTIFVIFLLLFSIVTIGFLGIVIQKISDFSSIDNRLERCSRIGSELCFQKVLEKYESKVQADSCRKLVDKYGQYLCLTSLAIKLKDTSLCTEAEDVSNIIGMCRERVEEGY